MSDRVPSRYRFDESLLAGSVKDVSKRVPEFKRDVVEDLTKVLNGKSSILSFDFAENLPTLLALTANLKNEGLENAVKFIQAGLYLLTSKCKRLAKSPNAHPEKYLFETSSMKVESSVCSNAKAETVIVVNPATKKRWAVKKLKVQTGSLACMGCGYEHNCSLHGCAILRNAAEHMEAALANYDHLTALLDQKEQT